NNATFTITATNRGPATASNVTITNPIPANAIFVSSSSSQGTVVNNGSALICSLGTLTNSGSAMVSLTFQTTVPGMLTNSAVITGTQPDHALSNNASSAVATVSVPAVSIGDATVVEPTTGTTNAVFSVTLDSPSIQTIWISYVTADDTAMAGSDYYATN